MGEDELKRRREHNEMIRLRMVGVPAQEATPESEADPRNPNRPMTHDRAAEIVKAWLGPSLSLTQTATKMIDDLAAALIAAREEGRREGVIGAVEYLDVNEGDFLIDEIFCALADKEIK